MRYVALFFVAVYLLFAYWQFNDPDPVWFVTLYLVPAFISFRAFQQHYSAETLIVLAVLYLDYAINSFMQMTAYEGYFTEGGGLAMKSLNQELAREASGLLICVGTFLIYTVYFFVRKKRAK